MMRSLARAVLIAGMIVPVGGCSVWNSTFGESPAPAAAAPFDPFAAERPTTASVGVVMPDPADFPHPWDASTYILRVTQFGVMPPLNGGVAFVGDSLTDWMRWNEMFPEIRSRNFGIAGDTTVGLKARINQVVAARPAKVFLMIGTNDVEFNRLTPEGIVANIGDCIDALQKGVPGVTIVVENLLPRQPQFDEKVRTVNALLKAAIEKRGLAYIDLYSHFVTNGRLDPTVTPDDIHLSGQGYLRWRDVIRPFVGNN
jgi:lysophospholipase L1-like esterase